jgi:hypothetical protein
MGEKFYHKLEVFLPSMLLNRNFLKENRYCPHAGWENFCAKIFPKLLLGQCIHSIMLHISLQYFFGPFCNLFFIILYHCYLFYMMLHQLSLSFCNPEVHFTTVTEILKFPPLLQSDNSSALHNSDVILKY